VIRKYRPKDAHVHVEQLIFACLRKLELELAFLPLPCTTNKMRSWLVGVCVVVVLLAVAVQANKLSTFPFTQITLFAIFFIQFDLIFVLCPAEAYNVDKTNISVVGISSGGAMVPPLSALLLPINLY
jgi:hypothetical protein